MDRTENLEQVWPERYSTEPSSEPVSTQGWLTEFNDPQLSDLVKEALENNHNLRATALRLQAAGATRRITQSSRYPQLSANAGASDRRTTFTTATQDVDSDWFETYNLGLNLIWEIDLWGKLRNRTQAAIADYEAAEADYAAAVLSLAANTVKAWFNAVEAELQLRLAQETLQSFENNLAVVESGYKRGVTRALDVRLTRANVEAARSNLKLRVRLRDTAGRSLEVLLGRYPADHISVSDSLPEIVSTVPVGLPSELLKRRPDLRAAERRFAASVERLSAANKEVLPTISLTVSGENGSSELSDLLDLERLTYRIAGNLAQPILQGGRIQAGIDLSDANSRLALENFAQSVLLAFQEVETFLAAETYLEEEQLALNRSAAESAAAESLAWQQYQRGLADIITVLESQRRAFNARSSLINVINDRLQNRVNLHLALGGDFRVVGNELAYNGPPAIPTAEPSSPTQ